MLRNLVLGSACLLFLATTATAGVITSGTTSVGIGPLGNLYDPGAGIGFRRLADGYDPISPGTPHEGWGVSLGGVGGRAAPFFFGNSNIIPNGAPVFGASTASISTFLNAGAGNLLQVDQSYSFAAPNVLAIDVTLTNLSGVVGAALFRRLVDWDPTGFSEIITANALSSPAINGTFQGFQDANPLAALSDLFAAGGGTTGVGDLGGGFTLDLGLLAAGGSTSFRLLHAISGTGQSEASLRAQLEALGGTYIITGRDDIPNDRSAGLAIAAVPEPASLATFGIAGLIGLGSVVVRRRRQKNAVAA